MPCLGETEWEEEEVDCYYILEGARASTGLSLLCVDVGYKHWSNDMPLFT